MATCSARRRRAAQTTTARCSRSSRPPEDMPALPRHWSASTATTAASPSPACSPTPTATCSARPKRRRERLGTVFEIAKTPTVMPARRPRWSASTAPTARIQRPSLIADANGDLFGTTRSRRREQRRHGVRDRQDRRRLRQHAHHAGQLQRRRRRLPVGSLIADANGDLFGTTSMRRDRRLARCSRSPRLRRATPARRSRWSDSTAVRRRGIRGGLIADANGDLFGDRPAVRRPARATSGTVFEIVKTAAGYASTPTTLASFNGSPTVNPGSLIADANGDLFGTTSSRRR